MARIPTFPCVLALPLLARGADEPGEVVGPPAPTDLEGTDLETPRMEEIVVFGRSENLVGIADSSSQGSVGGEQIRERPLLRPGEIAETVPGVIVTQHSGSGKANQFFPRGFNLDHGTDFATYLEGIPINMPSHGHGQGYTDLNFLIPELVERVDYRKGPYHAGQRGWKGTVILRVEVLADGTAGTLEVVSSSGHEILDEAATAAVRRWRFEPARMNGVAVASHLEIPIRFELDRKV